MHEHLHLIYKSKYALAALSCIVLSTIGALHPTYADGPNCDLVAPPSDSLIGFFDGMYIFVYPRKPSEHYDGCQIAWLRKHKWQVAKFKNGALIELDTFIEDGSAQESRKCIYAEGKLVSSPDLCPDYHGLGEGLQWPLQRNLVDTVPPEDDIRVKP